MKKNIRATPLSCLGLKALLQLQAEQVDVSKELRGLGHPELITFTAQPTKSPEPSTLGQIGKYHVSSRELRTEDGIVFDSKLERSAYVLLKSRHVDFDVHTCFILQDKFVDAEGKTRRAIVYEADFVIRDGKGGDYIVDMKGVKTAGFKVKEKMFALRYKRNIELKSNIPALLIFLQEKGII